MIGASDKWLRNNKGEFIHEKEYQQAKEIVLSGVSTNKEALELLDSIEKELYLFPRNSTKSEKYIKLMSIDGVVKCELLYFVRLMVLEVQQEMENQPLRMKFSFK